MSGQQSTSPSPAAPASSPSKPQTSGSQQQPTVLKNLETLGEDVSAADKAAAAKISVFVDAARSEIAKLSGGDALDKAQEALKVAEMWVMQHLHFGS